jgi:O-acetylhomoserine/O-acetylserine sulfhydrylase-like pyridoxal-dependent enzyme
MPVADQIKAGVRSEMIRLSIGLKPVDGIVADPDQALDAGAGA